MISVSGLRLAQLLAAAGLEVASFQGACDICPALPGMRPRPGPPARPCSLTASRTRTYRIAGRPPLARLDSAPVRPAVFAPQFTAIGRQPG